MKCLSLLNTQVAKNWSRFEYFLDIIQAFALGEEKAAGSAPTSATKLTESGAEVTVYDDAPVADAVSASPQESTLGLEFLMRVQFVEKACDFMLGKKSPLCAPGEKRAEMGGSFSSPNFTPFIKILTKILTNNELLTKYPLSDMEKKIFLNNELLKTMLSSSTGGKQFGQCLANMCKDNLKLSKKVSKVFIKSINQSNYDNIKNYLTALKPFIRLNDSLK